MLTSHAKQAKEKVSSGYLSYFVKENLKNPSLVVGTLLKEFSSSASRVAFALDELNEAEKNTLLESMPLLLKIYYGGLKTYYELDELKDVKNKQSSLVWDSVLQSMGDAPPELVHAAKIRVAAFNQNANLFWSLIKFSKKNVNLADLPVVEHEPPQHRRVVDLSHLNMKNFHLVGGANFQFNLSHTDLSGGLLSCHHLDGSDFTGAKLDGAEIGGSMSYTCFRGSDLTKLKSLRIGRGNLLGADFRGAALTEDIKYSLKIYATMDVKHPLSDFTYHLTKHLSVFDKKQKKFDVDCDYFVYTMLLLGAKSQEEYAQFMEEIPSKLMTKNYWLLGSRATPFGKLVTKGLRDFRPIPGPFTIMSPEKPSESKAAVSVEKVRFYVPPNLEEYFRGYLTKPVPRYIAKIIIETIKESSFLDPSYEQINHADPNHFIPTVALSNLRLKDETLDTIASKLKTYITLKQLYKHPKSIIKSIEAVKANLFINHYKKDRLLSVDSVAFETKLPISESTSSVLVGLRSESKSELDEPLNRHPLYEEIFRFIDWNFKQRCNFDFTQMIRSYIRKDPHLDADTVRARRDFAHELFEIWEYKNVACLTLSSKQIAVQHAAFQSQCLQYGVEFAVNNKHPRQLLNALVDQLSLFPALKLESQTPDERMHFKFGSAVNKFYNELIKLIDLNIFSKSLAASVDQFSISKDIYFKGDWLDKLVMVAMARAVNANVVIIMHDGSYKSHLESSAYSTFYLGFDGSDYYSLQQNPKLSATKTLPVPSSAIAAIPSVKELKDSFFNWTSTIQMKEDDPKTLQFKLNFN